MTSAPPRDPRLRFGLFGGARVWSDGAELALGPPKQRAMLGLLLAAGGQPVAIGQFVTVLWQDEPAATAVNQIHRYVGALRRVFEADLERRAVGRWVLPTGSGYRLAVDAGSCDLLRFRGLIAAAESALRGGAAESAVELFAQAMEVAQAPAGDEAFRELPMFVALEDERVRAAVASADAALSCGLAAEVLPGLRRVAAEHPLDETIQASVMRCLAAAGRPADALATYDRVRERLREELGSDPGPGLVDAQRAVLAQASIPGFGSALSAVRPAQLPAAPRAFAGRGDVLGVLGSGGAGVYAISGMAGVGKTSLALHWAHSRAADYPDGQLYVNLRGFDASGRAVDPGDALRDLLQSLGVTPAALPDGLEARAGMWRTLLSTRRVLVVIDNARDAQQVQPLLPGRTDSMVIVTSRNRLASLVALADATLIPLEPFSTAEAHQFLTLRLGGLRTSAAPAAAQRLCEACAGLPLALAIVAARGVANPLFPLDLLASELANSVGPLDALVGGDAEVDLREVISWSYRALQPDAMLMLGALAVHPGPDISFAAAVSLSTLPSTRARAALTALTAANLLRETTPGRYAFHDLIRRYALEQLGTDTAAPTARLIDHYVRSTRAAYLLHGRPPLVPLDPAVDGVVPEQHVSVADAVQWYLRERAVLQAIVRRAADVGAYRSVLLITLDWRPMSQNVDAPRDMLPYVHLALEAAAAVNEAMLTAECHRDAGAKFARCGDRGAAHVYYTSALDLFQQLGDLAGQANTWRNLAVTFTDDPAERVRQAERAVDLARRCGVPHVLSTVLHAHAITLRGIGQVAAAFPALFEALTLAEDNAGGANLRPWVLSEIAKIYAAAGDLANTIDFGERAITSARLQEYTAIEIEILPAYGDALLASGQPDRAAQVWQRYLTLSSNTAILDGLAREIGMPATEAVDEVRRKLANLRVGRA
ncbi:BTAD domain-containing putative transcriptional regulator [Dactylosporangium cerinum]|uniref:BTAD domain-containing putative transcriptional regulator n=1 Tax=Dactylosporangium cerinum TaxID=1434730 RepID=A0ABV9WC85_9ACTN